MISAMNHKRLMIIQGILVVLAGVGIMWLWQYAYSPEGRARVIIAQLKNENTSLRGWMLRNQLIRPGFSEPRQEDFSETFDRNTAAGDELASLGHEALPIAITALTVEDRDVRLMAIHACGKFHDPTAIQPLVKCIRSVPLSRYSNFSDVDIFSVGRCVDSLAEIGPEAYGPLLEVIRAREVGLRGLLPWTLGEKWGSAAMPYLLELLDDSDREIRVNTVQELGRLKDKRATDGLIHHLSDPVAEVRYEAAGALGKLKDKRATDALIRHLNDPDSYVRLLALDSLREIHDPNAIPAIRELLNNSDSVIRKLAAKALKELGVKLPPASQPGKP